MKLLPILFIAALPALAGYSECQPIVIHHTQVSTADQASYILTVNDTDSKLATMGNGGYVQNVQGYDIVFASDSQGTSLLNWDRLELYNPATGHIITHVQIGTLSHTADTTIYRCAGNPAISSFQGGATGAAWPAVYTGVWHMNETSGQHMDSTSNGNNSTAVSASTQGSAAGQIDGADAYTAPANKTTLPNGAFNISGPFTISCWFTITGSPGSDQFLFALHGAYNDIQFSVTSGHNLKGLAFNSSPIFGSTPLATNTLYNAVLTGTSVSGPLTLYLNGSVEASGFGGGQGLGGTSAVSFGGYAAADGYEIDGVEDEVRWQSGNTLTAGRIATDYNNQSSPSTFYTAGAWAAATPEGGSQVSIF